MNQSEIDWAVLRNAIILLVLALAISGALIAGSLYYEEQMYARYQKEDARFKAISRKYLAVDQEAKLIKDDYPRFVELYHQGIIGPEHRLNWLETLRAARDRLEIPDLRYQIDSREQYSPDYDVVSGPFELYSTRMKLTLDMLHEGDLFSLLQVLDERAEGLYTVSRCRLKRLHRHIELKADSKNLTAQCELSWETIDLPGEEGIKL